MCFLDDGCHPRGGTALRRSSPHRARSGRGSSCSACIEAGRSVSVHGSAVLRRRRSRSRASSRRRSSSSALMAFSLLLDEPTVHDRRAGQRCSATRPEHDRRDLPAARSRSRHLRRPVRRLCSRRCSPGSSARSCPPRRRLRRGARRHVTDRPPAPARHAGRRSTRRAIPHGVDLIPKSDPVGSLPSRRVGGERAPHGRSDRALDDRDRRRSDRDRDGDRRPASTRRRRRLRFRRRPRSGRRLMHVG